MSDPKYRLGIVGCGAIAESHAIGWSKSGACDLIAVCDIRRPAAEAFGAKHGAQAVYTDFEEMFATQELDVISICTWAQTHAEVTITAAQSGVRAILCEKPLCISLAEADAMQRACDAAGVKLAIPGRFRFKSGGVAARQLVADGAIGDPYLIWTWSEGGLGNWGVYMIDFMRFVLGDPAPRWVFAQVERKTDRYERGTPIEDRCAALIEFETGVRGVLESDLPAKPLDRGWYIHGTKGTLRLTIPGDLDLMNSETEGRWRRESGIDTPDFFDETLRWLAGSSDHRSDIQKHRPTFEIMMAMYESVRSRGMVTFPMAPGESPLLEMIEDGTLPVEVPGRYDIRLKA